MTTSAATGICPHCGNPLHSGSLQCPVCGEFSNRAALERLSTEALAAEPTDPLRAAAIWQQCLSLIPQTAPQYDQIRGRIAALSQSGGRGFSVQRQPRQNDPLPLAIAKTIGSMIISIIVYALYIQHGSEGNFHYALLFSVGLMLLILIHEMGHVVAMRWYGLRAGPPIFIPFVGALINLRESPKNALEEAVVGIAGPVAGTFASSLCLLWWFAHRHQPIFLSLASVGFLINLFNMLPVPPLDGGRVTAAVSPWIWMPGILVLAGWIVFDLLVAKTVPWILLILLFYAWPRIWATLKGRQRHSPYYNIGRTASMAMGAAYLLLGIGLIVLFFFSLPGLEMI